MTEKKRSSRAVVHDVKVLLERGEKKDIMRGEGGIRVIKNEHELQLYRRQDFLCKCKFNGERWEVDINSISSYSRGDTMQINAFLKCLDIGAMVERKKDILIIRAV